MPYGTYCGGCRITWLILIILSLLFMYGTMYQYDDTDINVISSNHVLISTKTSNELSDQEQIGITLNMNSIKFTRKMINKNTNKTVECDPNTFKYISLLITELSTYNKRKWSTENISTFNDYPTDRREFIRFKHKNGSLYWSLSPELPFYDRPFYRNRFIYYFYQLIEQYAEYIMDFDLIIYVHDGKNYSFNYNVFPFFVSEATQYANKPMLLHSISRSLAGQFVTDTYYAPYIRGKYKELPFEQKKDVAVFRGHALNDIRETIAIKVNNIINGTKYFDVKINPGRHTLCERNRHLHCLSTDSSSGRRMSVETEMKYKYQIIMDGFGVRDAFPRQIRYKSVMLKQRSLLTEYWYYDLINNENAIFWDNATQLIDIMKDIIDTKAVYKDDVLYNIMLNSTRYATTHLDVDPNNCFMVHMMQIYNKYFYDETSINITKDDLEITHDVMYNDLAHCNDVMYNDLAHCNVLIETCFQNAFIYQMNIAYFGRT
eukprot:174535_1